MSARECLIAGAAPRAGGDAFYAGILGGYHLVIAADAAGEWCVALGRVPDVVVGDFDSSKEGAAGRLMSAGARVVELPVAKDVSDLAACVDAAREMGVAQVDVCAAFDGRLDHTLAAFGAVLSAADLGARITEPTWSGWVLDGGARPRLDLALPPGTLFSVLAPGGARGVTVTGAEYPLECADIAPLASLGLSNVARGPGRVGVSVEHGALLVIAQA